MSLWRAEIQAWPHSTGAGQDVDQDACGPRRHSIDITADTIDGAVRQAKLFAAGVCTNPRVWQAPIYKVELVSV
jgi:hypothetical protein